MKHLQELILFSVLSLIGVVGPVLKIGPIADGPLPPPPPWVLAA